jgi:hypothetical protein
MLDFLSKLVNLFRRRKMFNLSYGTYDGSQHWYFYGPIDMDLDDEGFQELVDELIPEACELAVEKERKGRQSWVGWQEITCAVGDLLVSRRGFERMKPVSADLGGGIIIDSAGDALEWRQQCNRWNAEGEEQPFPVPSPSMQKIIDYNVALREEMDRKWKEEQDEKALGNTGADHDRGQASQDEVS